MRRWYVDHESIGGKGYAKQMVERAIDYAGGAGLLGGCVPVYGGHLSECSDGRCHAIGKGQKTGRFQIG